MGTVQRKDIGASGHLMRALIVHGSPPRHARLRRRILYAVVIASTCMLPASRMPVVHAASSLTWSTSVTTGPTALARPAVALGQDGNVYVFGGTLGDNTDYDTTFIYQPSTNSWSLGAAMPVAREGAQAVTLPDGRIAVVGGATQCAYNNLCSNGTVYNRVDVYTPATNSWSTLAPMQSPRYRFAAVLYQGAIYAIGGSDGTQALASVEAYDPGTDTWGTAARLPQATLAPDAVVDRGNRLDVFGGFDGGPYCKQLQHLFDIRWGRLEYRPGAPTARSRRERDGRAGWSGLRDGRFRPRPRLAHDRPSIQFRPEHVDPRNPAALAHVLQRNRDDAKRPDLHCQRGRQRGIADRRLRPSHCPRTSSRCVWEHRGSNRNEFCPRGNSERLLGRAGYGPVLASGATDTTGTTTTPISFTVPATATPAPTP